MLLHNIFITSKSNYIYIQKYKKETIINFIDRKSLISEDFFDLKTGLAGDILQKFINYKVKIAIVGDFSMYTSKSLKDFIYECNKGNNIFYLATEQQAIEKLGTLK
ncbi:hypothetical protein COF43_15045 [Bacillus toyonensis]|nr:hypothetical protein COF43_15045 [Bacillus toyonensis]